MAVSNAQAEWTGTGEAGGGRASAAGDRPQPGRERGAEGPFRIRVVDLDLEGLAREQGLGCGLAAAGSGVPRQQEDVGRAVSRRIKGMIGLVERQFPDWGKNVAHEKAMAIVASMVGALLLARAVSDAQLSRSIRKAARELIRGAAG